MEKNNNEHVEQSQDEQQSKKQNKAKCDVNYIQNINTPKMVQRDKASLEKDQPSTSKNMENSSKSVLKLKERTRTIGVKLARKRQQLQQDEVRVLKGKASNKKNENKVKTALQSMATKNVSTRKHSNQLPNKDVPHGVTKPNGIIPNEASVKPLHKHTKKQLISFVDGLLELVCRLTTNDKRLKSKVHRLAHNIGCLKEFPSFNSMLNIKVSTSPCSRQRLNSSYCEDDRKHNSRLNSETVAVDEKLIEKKKKEKCAKLTPAEILAKYINALLEEYVGEDRKENFQKFKCLPSPTNNYLETYALSLAEAGFGRIVEAEIRINRKNNRQAFIAMTSDKETTERDAIVLSPVARHYAFEGDTVRAFVFNTKNSVTNKECLTKLKKHRNVSSHVTGGNIDNSISLAEDDELLENIDNGMLLESEFEDTTEFLDTSVVTSENCSKAFVVNIIKQTESREIVGSISFANTTKLESKSYYKLKPHDMRVPMVYIPQELCKNKIESSNKEDVCGMLYVAKVLETDINGHCIGELVQPVGKAGNLQAEIKAILIHNNLKDVKPYEQKFHEMYEGPIPSLTEEDLKIREDLRKKCIFTIDPLTARDLDDAVSVEKLNEKEYEIGVHISDVSYFLTENSELDNLVKHRATSIYLVNEVIHMLPPSLCFKCSLLPGEDKFAFSVFWKWDTEKEEISSPRFTRSIINSCSQFAYEHAQKIIDNSKEDFDQNDFPEILNNWTPNDIKWRVLLLHHIAQKLKAQRYENGALSINNTKLRFQLHPETGEPLTYEVEGRQEANFLIEEFMLLANQSVAKFIHDRFPDISILRNHAPPLKKSLKVLKERLNSLGLEFNITSSKAIYESIQRLSSQSTNPKAVEAGLNTLLTKPMARAKYFCSEGKTTDADFWHYALSIPIYTHFTSPIRRYPDILVHRLLAAALNYCPPPQRSTDELHHLAAICNDQKLNAKSAGDESNELFFKRYVISKQSLTLKAVVTDIYKYTLNVVTIETGHTIAITYNMQKVILDTTNVPSFVLVSKKNSKMAPLKLQLFSTVNINLVIKDGKLCGFIVLPDEKQRLMNCPESSKRDKYNDEQEDDYYQETSSKSKNKRTFLRLKKKNL